MGLANLRLGDYEVVPFKRYHRVEQEGFQGIDAGSILRESFFGKNVQF